MKAHIHSRPALAPVKAVFSGECDLTGEFALPERPTAASGRPYDEARLLVRVGGEPVGFVTVSLATTALTRAAVLRAVERELDAPAEAELSRYELHGSQLQRRLRTSAHAPGSRDAQPPVSVTVVVCTRNRAHALRGCLEALGRVEHDAVDFIVVDNAPADGSTRELVAAIASRDPRFRYVREPHPGLSRARNRGLSRARGEIVAYTDDDVRVDPLWVQGLLRGFARRPDVGCVTGLVASASLELPAEQYFDARVWWSSSCRPTLYDARRGPPGMALHPYAAGAFGTGANFAARADVLLRIGGFDESLGAGSHSAGGEDLDIFVRLIRAGCSIAYEPAALVWHEHRPDREDLRRQMYAYGKALSAYVCKYASSRRTALDVLARLPRGLLHLGKLGTRSRRVGSRAGLGREMLIAEACGLAAGPLAYARARREQDRERRRAVAP